VLFRVVRSRRPPEHHDAEQRDDAIDDQGDLLADLQERDRAGDHSFSLACVNAPTMEADARRDQRRLGQIMYGSPSASGMPVIRPIWTPDVLKILLGFLGENAPS
jgi:hypothetical protein